MKLDEVYLEKFKRFEICLDFELDAIDILALEIEALKFGLEVSISASQRIVIICANELGTISGLIEYMELWPHILNVKEITDYTPSWKLNEDIIHVDRE